MSKRDAKLLLSDILDAVQKIKKYTVGLNYNSFIADTKTLDAANRLPFEFKEKYVTVDWFQIIGFRNRIVHDYMGVDYKIVWTIIEKDIDKLSQEIGSISKSL